MKKTIAFGIVFSFVILSFTSISGIQINNQIITDSGRGSILYVGGSGEGNYTTIQGAIDDASDGDTVFVFDDSSPYYETLWINNSINLIGEDKNTTIIDCNGHLHAIQVFVDWVSIRGFSIINADRIGICLNSNHNTILENIISENRRGIYLNRANSNSITGNSIISNNEYGIHFCFYNSYNIISDNNIISNNVSGIYFEYYSNHNYITNNNFNYNDNGIRFQYYCENNTITKNKITSNLADGIYLEESYNTIISDNIICLNHRDGIDLRSDISNSTISGNNISNNYENGIELYRYNCIKNEIYLNNISKNKFGISLKHSSNNNTIYHNNIINNNENAYDEGDDNTWDDGKYGNYWDDYEERYPYAKPKLFKPWMWNIPYEIEGGSNKDNCPLVKQWPNSVSIDRPIINVNYNSLFLRLLERLPLLQKLLQQLSFGL